MPKPFRWNIHNREQLGRLVADAARFEEIRDYNFEQLRRTVARVLAMGDDADYAFIGRTPENFYDYLSGIFDGLENVPALHIVQFSLRWAGSGGLTSIPERHRNAFFDYLAEEKIDPASIASSPRPLALVDYVVDGGTMENVVGLLKMQADRDGVDWNAVQRRLRIIGLVYRKKNSPNTWRWQQNQRWLDLVPDMVIKNVSSPFEFLLYLGNDQPKSTNAHHPDRWNCLEERTGPPTENQLKALNLAVQLFDRGRMRVERQALAKLIAQTHQVRQPATRGLVSALKSGGGL